MLSSTDKHHFLIDGGFYINGPKDHFGILEHTHDFVEFSYVFSGKCVHTVDGADYPTQKGDLIFINYGSVHSIKTKDKVNYAEYLKADGIIIFGSRQLLKKYDVPIVVIGESEEYDSVWLSNERAIEDAVELFLEKGHERIAFIGESLTESKNLLFKKSMEKNGVKVKNEYIMEVPERFEEAGYKAMNHLLSLKNPPTAVLTAYDNIALGAMRSIRERGLKIPEDISIIGMDDNNECEYFDAPLTSVTSYIEDLCEIVADMMFDRIKSGKRGAPKKIKVSTELIKRGSVGECKK